MTKLFNFLSSIFFQFTINYKIKCKFYHCSTVVYKNNAHNTFCVKDEYQIKNKINYSIIVSLISTSTSIYFLTDFTGTCLLNSVWVPMSTFAFLSWQTFSPYILIDPGGLLSSSVNVRFPEIEGDVFLQKKRPTWDLISLHWLFLQS